MVDSLLNEMVWMSNLIVDMAQKGATVEELMRAVNHSRVVIDAHKALDAYEKSKADNRIELLARKYKDKPFDQ